MQVPEIVNILLVQLQNSKCLFIFSDLFLQIFIIELLSQIIELLLSSFNNPLDLLQHFEIQINLFHLFILDLFDFQELNQFNFYFFILDLYSMIYQDNLIFHILFQILKHHITEIHFELLFDLYLLLFQYLQFLCDSSVISLFDLTDLLNYLFITCLLLQSVEL